MSTRAHILRFLDNILSLISIYHMYYNHESNKTKLLYFYITDGGLSNILQEKQVTIMSESECQKGVDALGGEIYGGHICFQHNTGGSCSVSFQQA